MGILTIELAVLSFHDSSTLLLFKGYKNRGMNFIKFRGVS